MRRSTPFVLTLVLFVAVATTSLRATERSAGLQPLDRVDLWTAPPVAVAELLAEDELAPDRLGAPRRIGFPMATDLTPANSGTWEERPAGGQVWRLVVRTDGALWTVLGFDVFRLQPGGELFVYDPEEKSVLGPYGAADIRDHGELWFPPIEGDNLVVELNWPESLRGVAPRIRLGTVSHGYKAFGTVGLQSEDDRGAGVGTDALGDSGACNIDVNCPLGDAWQDQKRGVVILLSGGFAFCSGSLINTTADDCRPYVLTANHCGAGASTTFGFNFERSGCGGGGAPSPTAESLTGATVLATFSGSDFTLLEMDSAPPDSFDAFFGGWSRSSTAPTESWGIHHPSGDAKKISFNDDALIDGSNWGTNHWRVTEWEQGTTEGGSSGSPLYDQNQRIVGQLHGGLASCSNITWDEYGKLSQSWTGGGTAGSRLQDWLDPDGTAADVLDGIDWSTCAFQSAGSVELNRSLYACSDLLAIQVRDDDLQGAAGLSVSVFSSTEPAAESVSLVPTAPGAGTFEGTLDVADTAVLPADGVLSVSHGDTITVEYVDADDGAGGTNVPRQFSALVDCAGPIISAVQEVDVTGSSARILWSTDEGADSSVVYGDTLPPSLTATDGSLVTSHDVALAGLLPCTEHYYRVESTDGAGNVAGDDNGGSLFSFTTVGDAQVTTDSQDTPVSIPDNDPVGATSSIQIADTNTVTDADVEVNVSHTYDGDLTLTLIAPDGTTVTLAARVGGSGNDYTATVFDDEAASPIASGAPPFTGVFQPQQPLSAVDGVSAAGTWRLRVVDSAGVDTGSILSWSLRLGYAQACGPNAKYRSHALEDDTCVAGGGGDANGFWEAGERVQFSVSVENDGTSLLTGVSAVVTPLTPGVVALDGAAGLADLPAGATGSTQSPHLIVQLPAGLACSDAVEFELDVQTDQGSWTETFQQTVGEVLSGGGLALDEDFSAGIPGGWTVGDGLSDGNTWYADDATDPLGCGNTDPAPPLAGPWATVDSDCAGTTVGMDEELISPVLDLSGASGVSLDFDHFFQWYSSGGNEIADVDVRSSLTGGAWINVARWSGASSANPEHVTLDITGQAAGAPDVQIRWHYFDALFDWFWHVDNVDVAFTAPAGCNMTECALASAGPPPVPETMLAARANADGSQIQVDWDDQCGPASTKILYGPLDQVASYGLSGSLCSIANPEPWGGVPAGSLWFVVVTEDLVGAESSWGAATSGERNGNTASGTCGSSIKDLTGSCP